MKILFIQDTLINAGTEKSLLQILPLFKEDIQYKVVYLYDRHDLKKQYEAVGILLNFIGLKGKYDFLNGVNRLSQLVQEEKPDLLVSSLLRSNLIARIVSLRTGVPLIGTFVNDSYNNYRLEIKQGIQRWKFKFFWMLDRLTAGIPKLYISNSLFIAHSHVKTLGVPLSKTKVLYRGREMPEKVWRKPDHAGYLFLSYGRLLQIKGFEELIKAFSSLSNCYPHCRLIIYGEGIHRPILENLINELNLEDKVFLPGVMLNVTDKLYHADCFVFPSWYEGFSGALIEAMMSGIPIIASNIPMNLEAVTPNTNSLVFPVRDVEQLAQQLFYAIEHPKEMEALGKQARQTAIERFDIKNIAAQYEQVLHEVYETYRR